ncbi:MAG: DEAD/DEAH box helicase [Candidatus Thorarchaeota archaeon]
MNKRIVRLLLESDEHIVGALIHLAQLRPEFYFDKSDSALFYESFNFYTSRGYIIENRVEIIRKTLINYSDALEKTGWNEKGLPLISAKIKNGSEITLEIILSNTIKMKSTDMTEELKNIIRTDLTFKNPLYENAKLYSYWTKGLSKHLYGFDENKGVFSISRGYINQLEKTLKELGLKWNIVDKRRILDKINFTFKGKLINYQNRITSNVLQKDFGVISSPCASGKTVMALYIISERKQPAIVIVHTKELLNQWIDRISNFLNTPQIGIIGAGKKSIGPITIGMVQTLSRKTPKELEAISENFGQIIFDECHHIPCQSFIKTLDGFDAKFMLGLSATPYRRDKLDKLIFTALGGIVDGASNEDLVESNRRIRPEIIVRKTEFNYYYFDHLMGLRDKTIELIKKFEDKESRRIIFNRSRINEILGYDEEDYSDEISDIRRFIVGKRHFMIDALISDFERNKLIVKDIEKEYRAKNYSLILTDRIKHCAYIKKILDGKKIKYEILLGVMGKKERKRVIDALNGKKTRVVIATGQLAGEGLDVPHINRLFIIMPISWKGRVEQYVGRILRPAKNKTDAKVYDYVDVNVENLNNAYKTRQRIYNHFK